MSERPRRPRREVIQGDALAWMDKTVADVGTSVLTSLPDISETAGLDLAGWRTFFTGTAEALIRWVPPEGVTIFYQSDIRREGVLVDKGYLVMRAAEAAGASLIFHKIVCREPPGSIGFGRPTFSHLIAVTRGEPKPPRRPTPDVLPDAGPMSWSKATGALACLLACRYLKADTATTLVVDPFCGRGTVLGVANALGLDAIGVDHNSRRCRAARAYVAPPMTDLPEGLDCRDAHALAPPPRPRDLRRARHGMAGRLARRLLADGGADRGDRRARGILRQTRGAACVG